MPAAHPPSARVLIAEGSVSNCGVLVILLENAGYDVISVHDGQQAVDALRGEVFDLAILKHQMSGLDGLEALVQLREFLPCLPVIICAGSLSTDQTAHYRELGVEALLPKPVDPFILRDKIVPLLTRRHPHIDTRPLTVPSFRGATPTPTAPMHSPLAAGVSKYARKLQADLLRLRTFRSLAILEGPVGSGRFELALSLAPTTDSRTLVCHADEFSPEHIDWLLEPSANDSASIFLIVLEADRLDTGQQTFVEDLLSGRIKKHAALSTRLRVVFCAQTSLCDLNFDELLLMRAVTATLRVPDFADRWMDWASISRAILSRVGAGRGTFDSEAIRWIDRYFWTGNYMQLHRTIELARRRAGIAPVVTVAHLSQAVVAEPDCNDPLFHDLLFHVHSAATD